MKQNVSIYYDSLVNKTDSKCLQEKKQCNYLQNTRIKFSFSVSTK